MIMTSKPSHSLLAVLVLVLVFTIPAIYYVGLNSPLPILVSCKPLSSNIADTKFLSSKIFSLDNIASRADADKLIIVATVDINVVDVAINLYEFSFKPYNIDNFLFVGVDNKSCPALAAASVPCFHYANVTISNTVRMYNSLAFLQIMAARNQLILDILKMGFTVVLMDLDIVFLANPLMDIKAIMKTVDVAAMWEQAYFNGGFIVLNPTNNSIDLWQMTCDTMNVDKKFNDQQAFNKAVEHFKKRGQSGANPPLKIAALEENRYACGVVYFDRAKRWLPFNQSSNPAWVVHNNYMVSTEAKVYRFKEHLMWIVDTDGYYSENSAKYLVYDNPVLTERWPSVNYAADQLQALTSALAIGRVLGRIVILPRLHCRIGSTNTYYDCPLNSLLAISAFDSQFKRSYRESSFLSNPKVPDAVRRSVSQPQHVSPSSNDMLAQNVTALDIRKRFQLVAESILLLERLNGKTVVFDTTEEQHSFDSAAKQGFRYSGYNQLDLL